MISIITLNVKTPARLISGRAGAAGAMFQFDSSRNDRYVQQC